MSSLDVAYQAASARAPIAVTNRELLWSGGVVEMSVPANASEGTYKEMEGNVHYLQFPRNIKGGVVNCFVHTDDPSCKAISIGCECSVF